MLLLALIHGIHGGCRRPEPAPEAAAKSRERESSEQSWLHEITSEANLEFVHDSGLDGSFFFPEHVGSGVALFDYDNDGDLDLYLVDSGPHDAAGRPAPVKQNRLFRQDAALRFVDVTLESGVGDTGYGMGCTIGDIDNDGDLDLFVTNYGPDALYRNDGNGRFTDVTSAAGVGSPGWSTSACFLDYDQDDDLDLFVATYVDHDRPRACTDAAGRPEYCGPLAFPGQPDLLFQNRGDGTFVDASRELGIADNANRGLGLACLDLDGDGWQDVFVANDGEDNDLWINRGGRLLENRAIVLGAAANYQGQREASMGVGIGDVNGDLQLDLLVSHLSRETNTLYLASEGLGFRDGTPASGLAAPSLPFTGFGTALVDLDLDGDLDLVVVNGRVNRRKQAQARDLGSGDPTYWELYSEPNQLFLNDGRGMFADASDRAAGFCHRQEVSRGLALGDIDGDGDLDAVITNCNGPARLFENLAPRKGRWLALEVIDPALRRAAVGAGVIARIGESKMLRVATATYSYLSASQPGVHFGLGETARVDEVEVRWPGGTRSRWRHLPSDRHLRLIRPEGGR